MSSTTLAGIVRLTKAGLAPYKGFSSSGVYRDSSSRDTAIQSSRALVYKVIILTIMLSGLHF